MAAFGLNEIDEHIPLTAVADSGVEKIYDESIRQRSVSELDHRFIEKVDLFKFVPEGDIILGELELFNIAFLSDLFTEEIERGEDPAAPALLLIRYFHCRNID